MRVAYVGRYGPSTDLQEGPSGILIRDSRDGPFYKFELKRGSTLRRSTPGLEAALGFLSGFEQLGVLGSVNVVELSHRVEKNHAYITGTPLEAPQKDVLYRALYEYLRRDIPSGAPTSIPPVPVVSEMAEYTVRSADGLETPSTTGAVLRLLGGTRFFPFEGYARPGDQLNETSIAPLQQALRSVDQVVMNPISFEACAVVKTVPGGKVVLPIEFGILRLIHYQKIFAGVSRNL